MKKAEREMEGGLIGLAIVIAGFCALVLLTSCTTVEFKTVTKDGSIIEAKADSFLWDRQIKGFTFDYQTGTVTLESFSTNPDKESISKLCDTVQTLVNAIPRP